MCLLIFVCLVRAIGRLGKDAIICFATLPGRELRRIVIDEPCNYRKQEAHRYSAHQHADDALDWRKRAPVRWKSDVATAALAVENACAYGQISDFKDKVEQENVYLESEI